MTVILLWILRVLVVLFVMRLLLRAVVPRRVGAPARSRQTRRERIGGELVRDPQCGTYVPKARAVVSGTGSKALYFCSTTCRDKYFSAEAAAKARKASA